MPMRAGPTASVIPLPPSSAPTHPRTGPPPPIPPPLPPASLPSPPPLFGVFLGRVGYTLSWTAIYVFHFTCAAYFGAAGVLYRDLPPTQLAGMLQLYSLALNRRHFRALGVVHFVIAALHVRFLVTSFGYNVFRRLLSLRHQNRLRSLKRRISKRQKSLFITSLRARAQGSRVVSALLYVYGIVLAPSGFFGVESPHFETLFLCRELVETTMQTHQAYTMSRLLPRPALNRFYVTVLVVNCWSTPLLHRFGGRNRALQRLLCLLSDILLDFISAVGVPVVLALQYLADYNYQMTDFPSALWYNDTWLIQFVSDASLILFGSWLDAFSRLVFSLGLLATIDDVKILIKKRTPKIASAEAAAVAASAQLPQQKPEQQRSRIVRWAHHLMMLYGVVIVAVQLHAEAKPRPVACVLQVRPWLIERPACALIEFNCLHTPTQTGNATDAAYIFQRLDEYSLEYIVMRHCPQVEILGYFQRLPNLLGFKSYNSTITQWSDAAAFTQTSHPKVRFVFLVRTEFANGTLPDGLMSTEFPTLLRDIEICGTNLHSLPDDLDTRWPQSLTLFIENAQLTQFPLVLHRLSPRMLSLMGNQITSLPPQAFLLPIAYTVALTGNPLTSLPETGVDPRDVFTTWMMLDLTNISALPLWMDDLYLQQKVLYMGGTPFCVDVVLNTNDTTPWDELLATRPAAQGSVDCAILDPIYNTLYPQYLEVRDGEV